MLCAASEFPLTGSLPAECIVTEAPGTDFTVSDWDLFGGQKIYEDALKELKYADSCVAETISIPSNPTLTLYKRAQSVIRAMCFMRGWSLGEVECT